MNKVRVKIVLWVLVGLLVAAQLVRPKRTNPPVVPSRALESHVQVPPQVSSIMKRSCYDCHSSETVWPWYSHVAPVSWLIADDVNQGRSHINFQDWEAQENPQEANEHLRAICKEVQDGGMPPLTYRMMHKSSRLSSEDVNLVCSWAQSFGQSSTRNAN